MTAKQSATCMLCIINPDTLPQGTIIALCPNGHNGMCKSHRLSVEKPAASNPSFSDILLLQDLVYSPYGFDLEAMAFLINSAEAFIWAGSASAFCLRRC